MPCIQKRFLFAVFVGALYVGALSPFQWNASGAEAAEKASVLILHSYHKGYRWTDNVMEGMEDVLNDAPDFECHVEYMDTKRHAPEEMFPLLRDLYSRKFADILFDVILSSDDNALNFLMTHRGALFGAAPIVFCGVNNFSPVRIAGQAGVTGVTEEISLKETVDLALKLHPGTQHIIALSDRTPTGRYNLDLLAAVKPDIALRAGITEINDFTLPELEATLKQSPRDAVILLLSFFRDRNGKAYTLQEGVDFINRVCDLPVYSAWDFAMGKGVVGGRVVSGRVQGKTAAQMASRILAGTAPENISIVRESPNIYMLDHIQLERFRIPAAKLPEDSVIINQPESFFFRYKNFILGASGVFFALVIMVVSLSLSNYRRIQAEGALKAAQAELQKHRDDLEVTVASRTAELAYANKQILREIEDRKLTEAALQKRTHDLIERVKELNCLYKMSDIVEREENSIDAILYGILELIPLSFQYPDKTCAKITLYGKAFRSDNYRETRRACESPIIVRGRQAGALVVYNTPKDIAATDAFLSEEKAMIRAVAGRLGRIIEKKEAEEQLKSYQARLQSLSSELLLAEERERRKIADDLHDSVGQYLAVAKIKLNSLGQKIDGEEAAESLAEIMRFVTAAIQETRSLTFQISPPILYKFGLSPALEWLAEEIEKQHALRIRFEDDGEPKPLDDSSSILLFRAARELVYNMVKHAQAREAGIFVGRNEGHVKIVIEDDGIGFNTAELENNFRKSMGYGLLSIQEKLNHIGGRLKIESERNQGSKFVLIAPLKGALEGQRVQ